MKNYREFIDSNEAEEWGVKNYGDWISKNVKFNLYNLLESESTVFDLYTGNKNVIYNNYLNGLINCSKKEEVQYKKEIEKMNKELHIIELPENIVVYRYTRKQWVNPPFQKERPKVGESFVRKDFTSTTLVEDSIKDFAKQHGYNCMLKIYLPKGTKGAYIGNSYLHEDEFLLPTNCTFKLLKYKRFYKFELVKRSFYKLIVYSMYECLLVSQ